MSSMNGKTLSFQCQDMKEFPVNNFKFVDPFNSYKRKKKHK